MLFVEIPAHSFSYTRLERFGGPPTQLPLNFRSVDGIATIMARAILHEGNLLLVTFSIVSGPEFVQDPAERMHDIQIDSLVSSSHIVCFTDLSGSQYLSDCTTMVFHIEPVAHLLTIAVDGQ